MNSPEIALNRQLEWRCIADNLESALSFQRVTCLPASDGRFYCKSETSFLNWVPTFLHCLLPTQYVDENRRTVQYLFDSFGEARVKRIFQRWGVDVSYHHRYGIAVTKSDIEQLFIHLGYIHKDDLKTIFREVRYAQGSYLHLDQFQVQSLQAQFRGKEFQNLVKEDFDELCKIASPFSRIETIFLNNPPVVDRSGHDKGEGFWEIREVVFFSEQLRRGLVLNHRGLEKGRYDDYFSSKQLIGPLSSRGFVIYSDEGYRFVWDREEDAGRYRAVYMKPLGACGAKPGFNPQVAFLPTQFWSGVQGKWGTWIEDLTTSMGSSSIIDSYEHLRNRFTRPDWGFVTPGQKVNLMGYSLGAVQAQRLTAALLPDEVIANLTVVCTPGIDHETADWYAANVERFTNRTNIRIIRNDQDAIGHLGDKMLGAGCEMIQGVGLSVETLVTPERAARVTNVTELLNERIHTAATASFWWAAWEVLRSLVSYHREEYVSKGCMAYGITNGNPTDAARMVELSALDNRRFQHEQSRLWLSYGDRGAFVNFLQRVDATHQLARQHAS